MSRVDQGDFSMRGLLLLTIAAAVAVPASSAQAADVATIGCVAAEMGQAGQALLSGDMEMNLENSGKEQKYRDETGAAIRAAASICATRYGWSDKAKFSAVMYTMARAGWPVAQRMAPARKIDVRALERHFAALPEADRRQGTSVAVLTKLAQAAVGAGDVVNDNAAFGGAIFGLIGMEYSARADFTDS